MGKGYIRSEEGKHSIKFEESWRKVKYRKIARHLSREAESASQTFEGKQKDDKKGLHCYSYRGCS